MFVLKFDLVVILTVSLGLPAVVNARTAKEIQYSPIPTYNNYLSVVESVDETLEPIYEFSKDFIDATVPINFDVGLGSDEFDWDTFLEQYGGLLTYVIIMLAIGLLIPVIGIFFCAFRCCCNTCGAKPVAKHPRQGNTSIIFAGGFTIIFSGFLIFAIAVGMRSNVVIERGAENVFDKMIVTMQDGIKYSINTFSQMNYLIADNYMEFSDGQALELNEGIENIHTTLTNPDNGIDEIKGGIDSLKESINDLKKTKNAADSITAAKPAMNDAKDETVNKANDCVSSHSDPTIIEKCTTIRDEATAWAIPLFDDFGQLEPLITQMESQNWQSITDILNYPSAFAIKLADSLQDLSETAKTRTKEAGDALKVNVTKYEPQMKNVEEWMDQRIDDIKNAQGYYNDWGKLRYGLTFLLPLLLIFIVIFIILGFLIGMCCRAPEYKEKGCGNSSVSSHFFMINTSLIFIFAIVFAIAIVGYYAFGLLGQRYICNTFHTMDNVEGLNYLDENLDIEQFFGAGVTLHHLLTTCNANKPVYEVLNLKRDFDLDDIIKCLDGHGIIEAMGELNDNILSQIGEFEGQFNPNNQDPFEELKKIELDKFEVNTHSDQLKIMEDLVALLKEIVAEVPSVSDLIAKYEIFIANFISLRDNFGKFKENIKMGGTVSYEASLGRFSNILKDYFELVTVDQLPQLGDALTKNSLETVTVYLNRVQEKMLDTVGLCGPASTAIEATLSEVCGNVFNPINAFWMANFFALMAFVPLLILFIFLNGYFKRFIPSTEEKYREDNYYRYNPPGTRGSTIQAYDVREHHQPTTPPGPSQEPPNSSAFMQSAPLPAIPAHHYYNPNSGGIAARTSNHAPPPLYPSLSGGDSSLSSAAALAEKRAGGAGGAYVKNQTALGPQGRNMRRQQEYPYAMKGTSIASDASTNGEYTRF